jgi:hypothetical protein
VRRISGRTRLDRFLNSLANGLFGEPPFIRFLEVHPVYSSAAKVARLTKCGIRVNAPFSVEHLGNAIGLDMNGRSKCGTAHAHFVEFFLELFAREDGPHPRNREQTTISLCLFVDV